MEFKDNIDLTPAQRALVQGLLARHLPGTTVWAFGSRVSFKARPDSDLDLVVFSTPEQAPQVSALKEAFEESNLPFRVDLLVWDDIPENFRKNIEGGEVSPLATASSSSASPAGSSAIPLERLPEGWKMVPLSEVLTRITYGFTNPMSDSENGPWKLTAKDVVNGVINYETARKTTQAEFDALTDKSKPNVGDVLLTKDGSIGRVAVVDQKNICINQSVALLQLKPNILPHFLYYILISPEYQRKMESDSDGSTIKHIYITRVDKMEIPLPPISDQVKFLGIMKTLDDKIALNRATNQTLEQIAQALFKSWFVDFDPVHAKARGEQPIGMDAATAALFPDTFQESELGMIPAGWEVKKLSDLIRISGGGTPKRSDPDYWNGEIPWYSVKDAPNDADVFVIDTEEHITNQGLEESSTKLLPVGTTIISARGTVGKLALIATPMCMNQSCYGINGTSGIGPFYNYYNVNSALSSLQEKVHGAVFDTITTATFDTCMTVFSGIELAQIFETQIHSIMLSIESNVRQNRDLNKLRDSLLPKLLSGEISVAETETQVAQI